MAVPVVPAGCVAVTPWVVLRGVAAFLDFLQRVFGAQEVIRLTGPDGRVGHAEARINGGPLMMFDADDDWPALPALLRVYVEDVDEAVRRAVAEGSVLVTPPTTLWIGDRVARLRDPWDNLWWVHTHVAEPSPEQLAAGPPDQAAADADRLLAETLAAELRGRATRP